MTDKPTPADQAASVVAGVLPVVGGYFIGSEHHRGRNAGQAGLAVASAMVRATAADAVR